MEIEDKRLIGITGDEEDIQEWQAEIQSLEWKVRKNYYYS